MYVNSALFFFFISLTYLFSSPIRLCGNFHAIISLQEGDEKGEGKGWRREGQGRWREGNGEKWKGWYGCCLLSSSPLFSSFTLCPIYQFIISLSFLLWTFNFSPNIADIFTFRPLSVLSFHHFPYLSSVDIQTFFFNMAILFVFPSVPYLPFHHFSFLSSVDVHLFLTQLFSYFLPFPSHLYLHHFPSFSNIDIRLI